MLFGRVQSLEGISRFLARFLINIAQWAKLVAPRDIYTDLLDRYRYSMTNRDYRVHVCCFPRRSRHLGHRHAYVTYDEVKYRLYFLCIYHIDEHVHLAQHAQPASNELKVLDYELRRKHVHGYVSNCCSGFIFGMRNNSVGGSQAFASTS